MADRSPSHDPSVYAAIFDPDWEDAEQEDDDDDMDFQPATEEMTGSDQEAYEDAEENILAALLEDGDVEIEIANEDGDEDGEGNSDDDDEDENEDEEEQQAGGRLRPVFGMYIMHTTSSWKTLMQASHTRSIASDSTPAWPTTITRGPRSRSLCWCR